MARDFVNLNGQFIKSDEGYYNLSTNRFITNPSKRAGLIISDRFKIVGTLDQVEQFAYLNNIPLDEIVSFSGQGFWTRLFSCFPRKKKDVNQLLVTTKLKSINFDTLSEFNFFGLKGKCRMLEIIDGDTFIVGIVVPLDFLREMQLRKVATTIVKQPLAILSEGKVKMAIKIRCRLAGVDAVEMSTKDGPEAKRIVEDISQRYGNEFFFTCLGQDKYGRHLLRFYLDKEMTKDLSDYLVANHARFFAYYYGGKKGETTE